MLSPTVLHLCKRGWPAVAIDLGSWREGLTHMSIRTNIETFRNDAGLSQSVAAQTVDLIEVDDRRSKENRATLAVAAGVAVTSSKPVVLVADADHKARIATEAALLRRFGDDYRILAVSSAQAGLDTLIRLAADGDEVAFVAADLRLPSIGGLAFLERARELHRGTSRVLLIAMDKRGTRIPLSELESLQRASLLGQIDFWIEKGWASPEEWFYPRVQQALTAWVRANHPRHQVLRVVGEQWAPRSHELRDALARNTVVFGFYASDSEAGRQLISDYHIDPLRLPAIILYDGSVLQDPEFVDVAEALGVHTRPMYDVYDLVILGAGPAGLSAAVNAASEGLHTLVVEPKSLGGQAGTSSMIRNYLGFPRGISGTELTESAWEQALLFGVQFVFLLRATGLSTHDNRHTIELSDGSRITARAVIIATGVELRRLGIPALDQLVGMGVFYGAPGVEAPAMIGKHVFVVGGANSAAQAALHLSKFAARVTLLVRGPSLRSMSDYLTKELESTANVEIRLHTRLVDGRGESRLEGLVMENALTRQREEVEAAAVFVLIGAEPHTRWLDGVLQCGPGGFILTGREVQSNHRSLNRRPQPFETSIPGVFAIGDARHGSVKRVAEAVGEGSVAVSAVHQYLAEEERLAHQPDLTRSAPQFAYAK